MSYAPFGENYNNSGTSDYNFTGQNQDTEAGYTGYDDFLFREYSPVQGRWLSPDPAGMAAVNTTNPQSWNRYAYVLNNPLALVDPRGLDCVYLTDDGKNVEEIDKEVINDGECASTGGYWVDGEVSNANDVSTNYETGVVDAYTVSYYNGLDEFNIAYGPDNPSSFGAWTQTWTIPSILSGSSLSTTPVSTGGTGGGGGGGETQKPLPPCTAQQLADKVNHANQTFIDTFNTDMEQGVGFAMGVGCLGGSLAGGLPGCATGAGTAGGVAILPAAGWGAIHGTYSAYKEAFSPPTCQ